MINKCKLYDKVRLHKTGEVGFIVWLDDDSDSCMIEIIEKNEMPKFYKISDFEIIGHLEI